MMLNLSSYQDDRNVPFVQKYPMLITAYIIIVMNRIFMAENVHSFDGTFIQVCDTEFFQN